MYSIDIPRLEVGLLADDDPVDGSRGLQARRGVDDVAGDERLAELGPRAERHDGLAGVHGNPDLQVALRKLADAVADDERGAHGTLGVVAVSQRRAEQPHHRIADELLDDAPERLDLAPDSGVVRGQDGAHLLRVEPLGARGEPDEVDEDDRDDAALVPGQRRGRERRAAREAEPRDLRVLLTAAAADVHARSLERATAPTIGPTTP